jgi:hypothetical protein
MLYHGRKPRKPAKTAYSGVNQDPASADLISNKHKQYVQLVAFALFGSAVALWTLTGVDDSFKIPIYTFIPLKSVNGTKTPIDWVPDVHHRGSIPIGYLSAALLTIGSIGLGYVGFSTAGYEIYKELLDKKLNDVKWLDFFFSNGVQLVILGLISGIEGISAIVVLFLLGMITAVIQYDVEFETNTDDANMKEHCLTIYKYSLLPFVVYWFILVFYFSYSIEQNGPVGFIHAVFWGTMALDLSKQYFFWKYLTEEDKDYIMLEQRNIAVSAGQKLLIAWGLFIGYKVQDGK